MSTGSGQLSGYPMRADNARLREALQGLVRQAKAWLEPHGQPGDPAMVKARAALSESPVVAERSEIVIPANEVEAGEEICSRGDEWRIVGRSGSEGTHVTLTAESSDGEWSSTRTLAVDHPVRVVRSASPVPAAEAATMRLLGEFHDALGDRFFQAPPGVDNA